MVTICMFSPESDERVPTELKKNIMQARMGKSLTQVQLAQVYFVPFASFSGVALISFHSQTS